MVRVHPDRPCTTNIAERQYEECINWSDKSAAVFALHSICWVRALPGDHWKPNKVYWRVETNRFRGQNLTRLAIVKEKFGLSKEGNENYNFTVSGGKRFNARKRIKPLTAIWIPKKFVYETQAIQENSIDREILWKVQANKSTRWMPWHQEPMKDATSCDKLRGAANKLRSADFRMGKPPWWRTMER